METRENFSGCCRVLGRKNKKGFVVCAIAALLLLVLVVAVLGVSWRNRQMRNIAKFQQQNSSRMMGGRSGGFGQNNDDQFVIPMDASKSGEIAIVVGDLGSAQKAASDVAAKNGGSVYATHISYASNNLKNGSIVVQVPQENFDAAFGDLKKIGTKIIQESTEKIEPRYDAYPMVTPEIDAKVQNTAGDNDQSDSKNAADQNSVKQDMSAVRSDIAIDPSYIKQQAQNKGYVRVVFVDYGIGSNGVNRNVAGIGNTIQGNGQNEAQELWVVIILKSVLLVVLLVLLMIMFRRSFGHLRAAKKTKTIPVRQVKLQVKTRPRAVKTQRRKRL